jgi:hypothetical protein
MRYIHPVDVKAFIAAVLETANQREEVVPEGETPLRSPQGI